MPPRRLFSLLTLLVAATVLISPFSRDLFAGDETRYARIVEEMSAGGSFLVPVLGGTPYSDKPPLHFWLVIALTRIFGSHSAWPYVLPSIAAFGFLLWLGRKIGREIFGEAVGAIAGFVLATSPFLWGAAQSARMDMTFAALIGGSMLLLRRAFARDQPSFLASASAVAGLGVLVKGPMSAVIFLLVFAAESWRRGKRFRLFDLVRLSPAVLIPAAWIFPAVLRGGNQYGFDLLFTQTVGRSVDSFRHDEPLWFYLVSFPQIFFPWFILAAVALAQTFRKEATDGEQFCLVWFLSVLLPFSLISGKLEVYLLPAAIPLALLAGQMIAQASRRRLMLSVNGSILAIMTILAFSAAAWGFGLSKATPEVMLARGFPVENVLWTTGVIAALALALTLGSRSVRASVIGLGIATLAPFVLATLLLMPLINEISTTRSMVRQIEVMGGMEREVALYKTFWPWSREPGLRMNRVHEIGPRGLTDRRGELPFLVITRDSRATQLGRRLREQYTHVSTVRMKRKNYQVHRRK